jgi:hypothetical protein
LQCSSPRHRAVRAFFAAACFLLVCSALGLSQKKQPDTKSPPPDANLPKYDLHTEKKAKGAVDEINQLPWGKLDITELVLKSGDDKLHVYVSPKAFQDEMGIVFNKGDEIGVIGSTVKLDAGDVMLARELVMGKDSLTFRDDKGEPVWNPKTGK